MPISMLFCSPPDNVDFHCSWAYKTAVSRCTAVQRRYIDDRTAEVVANSWRSSLVSPVTSRREANW